MLYGTMLLEAGSHECRRLMLNNNRREVEKEVRMKIEGVYEIVRWYGTIAAESSRSRRCSR